MSMVWVAILTLVAGSGEPSASKAREVGYPAAVSSVRAKFAGASRSLSLARKLDHRRNSSPWSYGLDEFETEEVDETWMVHLDAMASVPRAWLSWARPRSSAEPLLIPCLDPPSLLSIPLRC
jgi:hypothetical protein